MTDRCKHELPIGTCGICAGVPRDRLQEKIDELTTTCKATRCNAEIVWAKTINDRNMPVDVEPSSEGNVELWLDAGVLRAVVHRWEDNGTGMRTSHFSTCTESESFRKPRART